MIDKIKLKNYSTTVEAEKSIMEIEQLLTMFGSDAIMKEFTGDGKVRSLSFKFQNKPYKLPANVEGVAKVLYSNKKISYRRDGMANRDKNAYNVAWRILKDWLHSQLSIIASGQAVPEEVLLPYLFDGSRTLYQAYKEGRVQLKAPSKEFEQNQEVLDNGEIQ